MSSLATAETRLLSWQRFGEPVSWSESTPFFPKVQRDLPNQGTLSRAQGELIGSIHPYPRWRGVDQRRPDWVDDLYYESLMVQNPLTGDERMYPLVARALRVTEDFSQVTFEIHPLARFQDGVEVTGADLMYSLHIYKLSDPEGGKRLSDAILRAQFFAKEVRFDLRVRGQAARDAITQLAKLKIVKPNITTPTQLEGISVGFTTTGPYRITTLGQRRLTFIKDAFYWGANLPTRRGFFNFREVEILAYPSTAEATRSLLSGETNLFIGNSTTLANEAQKLNWVKEPVFVGQTSTLILAFNSQRIADIHLRRALQQIYTHAGLARVAFGDNWQLPANMLSGARLPFADQDQQALQSELATCQTPSEPSPFLEPSGDFQNQLRSFFAERSIKGFSLLTGPDTSLVLLNRFRAHLQATYGINLEITQVMTRRQFEKLQSARIYDLIAISENAVTPDLWPWAPAMEAIFEVFNVNNSCTNRWLEILHHEDPHSQKYALAAKALSHFAEQQSLSVRVGMPKWQSYYASKSIAVPPDLSFARVHMYGFTTR